MHTRTLSPALPPVSALGLGCWAIGGPFGPDGVSAGWGQVDDHESLAALHRGLDLGVTFFDTADVYGAGHSETLLGRALVADRDRVVIATKFGNVFDEHTRRMLGQDVSPAYIRRACEASLRRLHTDHIDLYQCHVANLEPAVADEVAATLEELLDVGLIRAYGVSTDDPDVAGHWAGRRGFAAVQLPLNVLEDAPDMLALCEEHGLAGVANRPLAMGLLAGKFDAASRLPAGDVRASGAAWLTAFDADGRPNPEFLERLGAVRDVLASNGRTLVQGALAWIWARSERTIPVPGFKTVAQLQENAAALAHGPLSADELAEVEALLERAGALAH
jgi:aryl-alcohol dehydrogenase-like predicted oxidoreductase